MKSNKLAVLLGTILCFTSLIGQRDISTEEENEQIRERWNLSLVRDSSYTFSKEANNLLRQTTKTMQPGKALCVAMGQGRNALYLARNGWEVTGFDLVDGAVGYAVEQAKKEQIELLMEIASFDTYDFGNNKWDLI